MGNLFCTDLEIHRRYDLKGSTLGRYTPGEAWQTLLAASYDAI